MSRPAFAGHIVSLEAAPLKIEGAGDSVVRVVHYFEPLFWQPSETTSSTNCSRELGPLHCWLDGHRLLLTSNTCSFPKEELRRASPQRQCRMFTLTASPVCQNYNRVTRERLWMGREHLTRSAVLM